MKLSAGGPHASRSHARLDSNPPAAATTTRARIYRLPNDTRIIDTPGIREFGLWKLSTEELSGYFEEFEPLAPNCRFNDCSHSHEPNCAVREAAATV